MKNATPTNAHEHTRFTQVRGPRVEVTPLLLPVSLSYPGYLRLQCAPRAVSHTQKSLAMEELPLSLSRVLLGGMKWFLASSLTPEGMRGFI